jgi:tetratricopeptide (TPR) repeat protein
VYALDGQQEKSIQTIESAIAIAPNNPMGYQQLAAANYRIGNIEAAKASLEKGISALPNSFDLQMALAELHMSKQDMPAAIKIYESLLEAHPSSLVAINNYASVIADFDTDKAKLDKAYTLAQKLKTSNVPQFQDTLGWISYRVGKYDEAQAQILQAIRKMPDYAVFHYHLGKVYIAKQDKLKAKESLEKALELSKNQNFSYTSEIKALLKSV